MGSLAGSSHMGVCRLVAIAMLLGLCHGGVCEGLLVGVFEVV